MCLRNDVLNNASVSILPDVTERVRQLLWLLGCFALWVATSVVVFQLLGVMAPLPLYISALVGFMLVAEYLEPALSEVGLQGETWAVTLVGFAVFVVWMVQWILTELQAMLEAA